MNIDILIALRSSSVPYSSITISTIPGVRRVRICKISLQWMHPSVPQARVFTFYPRRKVSSQAGREDLQAWSRSSIGSVFGVLQPDSSQRRQRSLEPNYRRKSTISMVSELPVHFLHGWRRTIYGPHLAPGECYSR